jgi:peptide/nickel transport system ATP-binding protein
MSTSGLMDIRGLSVDYLTARGRVRALRQVDIHIPQGRTVGLVGESGCGKSTVAVAVMRLLAENAVVSAGAIMFEGRDLLQLDPAEINRIRGDKIAMIFQDPMTSLNPMLPIRIQMTDIQYWQPIDKKQKRQRAEAMLDRVGIPDPRQRLDDYPHEFSGGMRQRIMIAMALLARPSVLIADEPTTALDATMEAQIVHLLVELKAQFDFSILFVSHSLGLVAEICDHVAVMYAGECVESGDTLNVFERPGHPYTRALVECDPARITEQTRILPTIPGEVPDLVDLQPGCIFKDRCREVMPVCTRTKPPPCEIRPGHVAACHRLTDREEQ